MDTIVELLDSGKGSDPAITALERKPLTYQLLRDHTKKTADALAALGIGRNDRVAVVLPNGPEMAAAFIAISACATVAPLNPGYRREEFEFYLADLRARALLIEQDSDSLAMEVARKLDLAILELKREADGPAGLFEIASAGPRGYPDTHGLVQAEDIALVLHTSGTTSRPKLVPLSQRNVCISANNIRETVALGADDRGLNIMPLFHIHGLIAGLLAPLAAGGSVCCAPGFNALKFFAWLKQAEPTWYTAVPAMHEAILGRTARQDDTTNGASLRFIRSSSSPLSPKLLHKLENAFEAPVIEAYGMTEAAHQMTSNPLPPRPRKAGTVGIAAGPEIAIVGEQGRRLSPGYKGEVVIRGDNVMSGYEGNHEANAESFIDGWFRTGDEGVLDEDGYLTITGRLKEIINRAGEKISPREVDEALLDHPAVDQAVTFAMPHPRLGEEVAAAVVLREDQSANEGELRRFAAERLADFKVPRKIVLVEDIPKGVTGKWQRIGLAEKLGLV
jgi:acyl-CoA synthetase (AMP-forming)/AMP-acid ligase II